MNFVSKFDGSLPFTGTHPKAQTHIDTVHGTAPADAIVVKDAQLLFTGDFKRSGTDLVISKDDHELVLSDYFKGEKRAALASQDGAYLTGKLVDALTGHVDVAQADGSAAATKIIGHVTKLTGTATVVRNGVSIILNNGDNVYQGDVVQSGSNSSLGITFIDGSVFGLASNAKMVLNEMVYDPNGSNNSSLLSLVQGTVSFVAGATAKHGDMKVDTPVATMGIRGTAVLVEIEFEVMQVQPNPIGPQLAPPVRFQVLVEPDGTSGSYVLLDRTTLAPIATVSQPGTVTSVSGTGAVSFLASAQLPPEVMRLISEVFSQRYTDNSNPRSDTHFTDTVIPDNTFGFKLANGDPAIGYIHVVVVPDSTTTTNSGPPGTNGHIPGPPTVHAANGALSELAHVTASPLIDTASNAISFSDVNAGDTPTASATFAHFTFTNAQGTEVTTLTNAQLAAIAAVAVPLVITQDPTGKNIGTATWTYNIADHALDFLAEGETLTLTYIARVDNNFAPSNEFALQTFTITITGTNDAPTISATNGSFIELPGSSSTIDHAGGTITFADVDLTDRPAVTAVYSSFALHDANGNDISSTLTPQQIAQVAVALTLTPAAQNGNNGTVAWSYDVADSNFDFLAAGDKLTLTYIATVDDGHGGVTPTPVTVTITGSNGDHLPTIEVTSDSFSELANPSQPNPTGSSTLDTASGTITFTDADLTDRPVASAAFTSYTYTDASLNPLTLTSAQLLAIAAVKVPVTVTPDAGNTNNGSATWSYSLADSNFDFLAAGEILTLTYTATVDDGHGGVVTTPFTITITGTNDTPVITSLPQGATLNELADTHGSSTPDKASGAVTFTDADLTDTHEVTIKSVSASGTTTGLANNATVMGWLTLGNFTDSTDGGTGSRVWNFSAADQNFDYLAAGESVTLTYVIQVDDHNGGLTTQNVTVTINGSNDKPTITATSDSFHELTNASQPNPLGSATLDTASGTISFTDLDLSDRPVASAAFTSFTFTDASLNPLTLTDAEKAAIAAVKVPLTITPDAGNTNNGSATWSYSLADSNFDFLAAGQILTLTYTATVDDGHGGVVTTPFTITITGTNDTPVITSDTQGAEIPEIANAHNSNTPDQAAGAVTFTDADLTDTHAVTIKSVSISGTTAGLSGITTATELGWLTLGSFTDSTDGGTGSRAWSFSAADHYFDYLDPGQHVTLTYTVQVDDGHGGVVSQDVTITINGSAEPPAPIVDLNDQTGGLNNVVHTPPNSVDPFLISQHGTITDSGSNTLMSMTITLTNPLDASSGTGGVNIKEFLGLTDDAAALAAHDGLTVTLSPHTNLNDPITLTISGQASVADYQAILDGVQYIDTKGGHHDETDRTITVVVNDGSQDSTVQTTTITTSNVISGTNGADTLISTAANDYMTGGGGTDNFVFNPLLGHDTIADFAPATDSITFSSAMFSHNVANVLAATHDDGHGNTVITLDANDTIMLLGVTQAQLAAHQADFHFV